MVPVVWSMSGVLGGWTRRVRGCTRVCQRVYKGATKGVRGCVFVFVFGPSVRLTIGSKGMYSNCSTVSSEGMSTAVRVRVSNASRGGSFHFAAMAAKRSNV